MSFLPKDLHPEASILCHYILDLIENTLIFLEVRTESWGAWIAQLVKCQVMISQSMGLSPATGSVLTAQSLGPASDYMSPPLSLYPSATQALSLCL